jgi:hypothetical protein
MSREAKMIWINNKTNVGLLDKRLLPRSSDCFV